MCIQYLAVICFSCTCHHGIMFIDKLFIVCLYNCTIYLLCSYNIVNTVSISLKVILGVYRAKISEYTDQYTDIL